MISVLMPTYNCAEFISEAIQSILFQSFRDYEFLIIDDGSEDDTESIVKSFSDERIRYLKKTHSGLADTLDYGLKIAQNDVVARMDADDISHPSRLEKHVNFINTHPGIDVLSNWYAVFKNDSINYIINRSISHNEIVKNLALHSDICHPSIMFKKSRIETLGGFTVIKEFDPFGDYVVWLRNKSKLKFYNLPEVLHYYRARENSLSNEALANRRDLIFKIQEPYFKNSLVDEFNLSADEEIIIRGWREYLYGDQKKSFSYWKELGIRLFIKPSLIAATILRALTQPIFKNLFGKRIPNRLGYYLKYFFPLEQKTIKEFRETLNSIKNVHN
ncbi:MAG: glycosyltransferase [Melioribacteraceae bacterium]|nr:glycosyltransferase [Melioribacteraceae bacterium]